MTLYSFVLYLHILGALALFAALGLEGTGLAFLRRATTAGQVRDSFGLFGYVRRLGPPSMLVLLLSGLYLTVTAWGAVAWIVVALAAVVLLGVLGARLSGRRLGAVARAAAAENGPLSPAIQRQLQDPLLPASFLVRAGIALGIVFLMTVKPDLAGALLGLGLAALAGLVASLPAWRRGSAQGGQPAGDSSRAEAGQERPALSGPG